METEYGLLISLTKCLTCDKIDVAMGEVCYVAEMKGR